MSKNTLVDVYDTVLLKFTMTITPIDQVAKNLNVSVRRILDVLYNDGKVSSRYIVTEHIMPEERKNKNRLIPPDLLREWDHYRLKLNPDAIIRH